MKIIPRKDIGLPIYPNTYYPGPFPKIGVCIHNMGVNTSESITLEQAKKQTMINYNYHLSKWKAIDILEGYDCYNINGEATFLECRPWWSNCDAFSGMATLGYKYIGIEVSGDFDVQIPNPIVIDGLVDFVIWLYETGKISNPLEIKGHKDFNAYSKVGPTSCPGKNLYALLPEIRKKVENKLKEKDKEVIKMLRYGSPITSAHHFPDVWTKEFPGQWLHLQLMDNVDRFYFKIYATKSTGEGGFFKEIYKSEIIERDKIKNPNPYVKLDLAKILENAGIKDSCSVSIHAFSESGKPVYITCAIREFK